MTNEVSNVPELRFVEYQKCWKTITLGEISKKIGSGKTPLGGSSVYLKSGIPFLRSQNIQNGILDLNELVYIDASTDENMKNSRTYYGDLLLNITGASIGRVTVNTIKSSYANLNQHVCIIRLKEFYDSNFIGQYLISQKGQKKIFMAQSGGSREGLNFKEISKLKFSLPNSAEEQVKIGDFFSKLDRQIELEEQKLKKLEEQKRGYMQKIFSQELRFKDEDGNDYTEWKTKKLDELGEFNSGVGFPEKYQGGNTGVPFLKISDMNLIGNEKFMNTANNYVSIDQIKQKKWKVIQNVPAIIFAKVGAAIMLNRKRMILNPFLIDNNTMSYSFSNHWDTNFGYVVFQTLNLPKYAQVGALPSYNSKDIGIIKIRLPIKEEQEKIGGFFSKLDEIINKQTQKIDGLKLRKQGFLQKMFI